MAALRPGGESPLASGRRCRGQDVRPASHTEPGPGRPAGSRARRRGRRRWRSPRLRRSRPAIRWAPGTPHRRGRSSVIASSVRRVRWPAGPGGWPGRGIPRAAVRCTRGAAGAAGSVPASLCLVPSVLVALVSSCRGWSRHAGGDTAGGDRLAGSGGTAAGEADGQPAGGPDLRADGCARWGGHGVAPD